MSSPAGHWIDDAISVEDETCTRPWLTPSGSSAVIAIGASATIRLFAICTSAMVSLTVPWTRLRSSEPLHEPRSTLPTDTCSSSIDPSNVAGSVELGKRADITVVDLTGAHVLPVHSPISAVVYAAQATDVRYVLVDGHLLVDRGQLTARTGLDLARLRAQASERVPQLMRRAGLA